VKAAAHGRAPRTRPGTAGSLPLPCPAARTGALIPLAFGQFRYPTAPGEEVRHPRRSIPVATYLAVAVIAVLYGVSAWAMTVAAGPDRIVQAAHDQGPDVVFNLAAAHLGHAAGVLGHVLFSTSILAAAISFHNTIARYVFALGREHALPPLFGRTSTSGAPRAGSIAQTVIGLCVIVGFAVSGADPVVSLFYVASTSGALGILLLLFLAGLSVLGFFGADKRGENAWRTRVAPALSLVGLAVMVALVLANFATLLGVDDSSPLRWGIPAAFAVTGLTGGLYGLALKTRRSDTYAAIGRGPRASLSGTVLPPTDYALGR
jgi:amino acid transporter